MLGARLPVAGSVGEPPTDPPMRSSFPQPAKAREIASTVVPGRAASLADVSNLLNGNYETLDE